MTERTLPQIGVGTRTRPQVDTVPRPVAAPRVDPATRTEVARREALLTTPARAGMLIGASAAVYAVTLAGVAALQSETDGATAAARAPYQDYVSQTRAANDALEAQIQAANVQLGALGTGYTVVGAGMSGYQARLDELAALVSKVQGSAAALPTRIQLPTVSVRSAGVARSSGAARSSSGGGGGSSGTGGKTGASGH